MKTLIDHLNPIIYILIGINLIYTITIRYMLHVQNLLICCPSNHDSAYIDNIYKIYSFDSTSNTPKLKFHVHNIRDILIQSNSCQETAQ